MGLVGASVVVVGGAAPKNSLFPYSVHYLL